MQMEINRLGFGPVAVIILSSALAACTGDAPSSLVPFVNSTVPPSVVPISTPAPTPLATEPLPISTVAPSVAPTVELTEDLTEAPAPPATAKPTKSPSFYKPPGWDGASDVDCKDFDTHEHAQSFFVGTGGTKSNDPHGLDSDGDAISCESMP